MRHIPLDAAVEAGTRPQLREEDIAPCVGGILRLVKDKGQARQVERTLCLPKFEGGPRTADGTGA